MKTSIEVVVEVEIERPPSVVWLFLADVDRMPEWLGEFEAASKESDGPMGVGAVIRYTVHPGSRSGTAEITEWEPPHRLAWDGPPLRWGGGGARPRGSHTLSASGDASTFLVSSYHPELSGLQVLLRPYLTRWLRRRRRADTQTLKALVEAERLHEL
jgi:uncharacterized protein YndB with AHSA1/START domain